jgi:pilus assembly protein FimV
LSSTLETPTIETRTGDRTLETPTLETRLPDAGTSTTARLRIPGGSEDRADQTAEIDLEDLGLDLTGLDDAARDMATGLQEALPPEAAGVDFDLSASGAASEGEESTAEMEKAPSLSHITNAMGKSEAGARTPVAAVDDTVEQPGAGDSLITPALSATSDELESLNIDLDLSSAEPSQSDLTATGLRTIGTRGPEDPTMTEVGTKLDLARAYLDMGDPDGARSILNEVIEEGDPAQRQEARQLLDSLDS